MNRIRYFGETFIEECGREESIIVCFVLFIIGFIVFVWVAYMIHGIFHELGHLIGCKLVGYQFALLRIGTLTVIKKNKKWSIKVQKVYGSAGQCVCYPTMEMKESICYALPIMSGVVMNVIMCIVANYLMLVGSTCSGIVCISTLGFDFFCLIFLVVGLVFIATNGFPLQNSYICNDGRCFVLMIGNQEAQRCYVILAKIDYLLFIGKTYQEIPVSFFSLSEDADIGNDLIGSVLLMEYYYHLDSDNPKEAKRCLNHWRPFMYRLSSMMKIEISCELLYLELITEQRKEKIEKLYTAQVCKRLAENICDLHVLRIKLAYELYYQNNIQKAKSLYREAIKINEDYPISGEGKFNLLMMHNQIIRMKKGE